MRNAPPRSKAPAPRHARFPRLLSILLSAGLVGLVTIAFGGSFHYGFLNWDDIIYIRDYPEVSAGLSWRGVVWAWTHPHYSNWHPLTTLSFMLDTTLFGKNGSGFHIHNVFLHAAASVLLFLALRRMTGSFWRSAASAALFAVHPLRTESVAWITERKDVLSGFFLMATLYAYAGYARSPTSAGQWKVALLFACGLLSKSILVTVPVLLLLLDFWPLRRAGCASRESAGWSGILADWRPLVREKLPLFALSLLSVLATLWSVDDHRPMEPPAFLPRLAYIPVWLTSYLRFFAFPNALAAHYPYRATGPDLPTFVGCAWAILALTYIAWILRSRLPMLLVGWAWFLAAVLPVIGILPPGIQLLADRYTYVPQIFLGAAVVWALPLQLPRIVQIPAVLAWIGTLALVARTQTTFWRDDEALWKRTLEVTSENDFGNGQMGDAYAVQGRIDEAEPHYREALRINPRLPGVLNNLAFILRSKGRPAEAEPFLRQAITISPWFANPRSELADALIAQGKNTEALEHLQDLLRIEPQNVSALYRSGMICSEGPTEARDPQKAIGLLKQAAELHPGHAEIHLGLGNALFQAGHPTEAAVQFERALQADPKNFRAANNLGTVLLRSQRPEEAATAYRKALELNPEYPEALDGLAAALLQTKNFAEADAILRLFVRVRPDDPRALFKLGWIRAASRDDSLRDGREAETVARRLLELKNSRDPLAHDLLAAALAEQGRFVEARQRMNELLRAVDGAPQFPAAVREIFQKHADSYHLSQPWRE